METGVVIIQEPVLTKTSVEEAPAGVILDHSSMEVDKVNLSTVLDDEITSRDCRNNIISGEADVAEVVNGSGNKEAEGSEREKGEAIKTISVVEDSKIVKEKTSETEKDEQGHIFVHEPDSFNKNTDDSEVVLSDVTLEKEIEDDLTRKPDEVSDENPIIEEDQTETKHSPEQEEKIGTISKVLIDTAPVKVDEENIEKSLNLIPIKTDEVKEEKDSRTAETSVNGTEAEHNATVSVEEISSNSENILNETAPEEETATNGESVHDVEVTKRVLEAEKEEEKEEVKTEAESTVNAKEKEEKETVKIVSNEETTSHESESLKGDDHQREAAEPVETIKHSEDAEQISRELTVDNIKEEDITQNTEEVQESLTVIKTPTIQGEDDEEHEHVLVRDIPQGETLVTQAETVDTSTVQEPAILKTLETKTDETDAEPSLDLKDDKEQEEAEMVKTVISSDEVQESITVIKPSETSPELKEEEDQSSKDIEGYEHVLGRNMPQGEIFVTEAETLETKEDTGPIMDLKEDKEQEETEKLEQTLSDLALKVDKAELKVDQVDGTQTMEQQRGLDVDESEAEQIDRTRTNETEESPIEKLVVHPAVESVEQIEKPYLESPSELSEETSKTVDEKIDEKLEEDVTLHQEDQEEGSYGFETKGSELGEKLVLEERSVTDLTPLKEGSCLRNEQENETKVEKEKIEKHEPANEEVSNDQQSLLEENSDEVIQVSSATPSEEREGETVVETEKIEDIKANEEEQVGDKIQKSVETVKTVDVEPVNFNEDIEESLNSTREQIQTKSMDKENVPIDETDEVNEEKASRTAETSVKGTEVEHNATVSVEEISKNTVNETAPEDDHQGEHAERVEAIKNSDGKEKISHEVTGDREKEEDITRKTKEVQESPTVISIQGENIESKDSKDIEEDEHVLVRDMPLIETLVTEAEAVNTSTVQEAAILKSLETTINETEAGQETKDDTEPSLDLKDDKEKQETETVRPSDQVDVQAEELGERTETCSLEIKYESQGRKESVEVKSKETVQDESTDEKHENLLDVPSGESETFQVNEPETVLVATTESRDKFEDISSDLVLKVDKVDGTQTMEEQRGLDLNEPEAGQTDRNRTDVESVEKMQKPSPESPSEVSEETSTTVDEKIEEKPQGEELTLHQESQEEASYGLETKEETTMRDTQQGETIVSEAEAVDASTVQEAAILKTLETTTNESEAVHSPIGGEEESQVTEEDTEPSLDLKEDKEQEETETVKTVILSDEVRSSDVQAEEFSGHTKHCSSEIKDESQGREESVEIKPKEIVQDESSEKHVNLLDEQSGQSDKHHEKEPETVVVGDETTHDQSFLDLESVEKMQKPSLESPSAESEETSKTVDENIEEKTEEVTQHQKGQEEGSYGIETKEETVAVPESSEIGVKSHEEESRVPNEQEKNTNIQKEQIEKHEATNEDLIEQKSDVEEKSVEVIEVLSASHSEEPEGGIDVEAEKIEDIKANEEKQVADKIQKIPETVETVDTDPVKFNEDDIEESLNSNHEEIQIKSRDKENVPIYETDEVNTEKDSKTAETSANGREAEHIAMVPVEEISRNIVNETAPEDDRQGEKAEPVVAIGNSDDAEKISHEVSGDREKEEAITRKTDEVQETPKVIETPTIQGEDIESKASKDTEQHEHVLVRGMPQVETLLTEAESVDTSKVQESALSKTLETKVDETEAVHSAIVGEEEGQETKEETEPSLYQKADKEQEEIETVKTDISSAEVRSSDVKAEEFRELTKPCSSEIKDESHGREESVEVKTSETVQEEGSEKNKSLLDAKTKVDQVDGTQTMEEQRGLDLKDPEADQTDQSRTNETEERPIVEAEETTHDQALLDVISVEKMEKPSLESPSAVSEETSKNVDEKIEEKPEEEVTLHQEGQEEGSGGLETKEETISEPQSTELREKSQEEESCTSNEQERETKVQNEQIEKHESTSEKDTNAHQTPVEEKSDEVIQVSSASPSEGQEGETVVEAKKIKDIKANEVEQVADRIEKILETVETAEPHSSFPSPPEKPGTVAEAEKIEDEKVKETEPMGDMSEKGLEISETKDRSIPLEESRSYGTESSELVAEFEEQKPKQVKEILEGERKEVDETKAERLPSSENIPQDALSDVVRLQIKRENDATESHERQEDISKAVEMKETTVAQEEHTSDIGTFLTEKCSMDQTQQVSSTEKGETKTKEPDDENLDEHVDSSEKNDNEILIAKTSENVCIKQEEFENLEAPKQEESKEDNSQEIAETIESIEATSDHTLAIEAPEAYQTPSFVSELEDKIPKQIEEIHEEERKEAQDLQVVVDRSLPVETSQEDQTPTLVSEHDDQTSKKVDEIHDEETKNVCIKQEEFENLEAPKQEKSKEDKSQKNDNEILIAKTSENVCIKQEEFENLEAPKQEKSKDDKSQEIAAGTIEAIEATSDHTLAIEAPEAYQTPSFVSELEDKIPKQIEEIHEEGRKEAQDLQGVVDRSLPVETSQEDQTPTLVSEHDDQTSKKVDEIHDEETKAHKLQEEENLPTEIVPRESFSADPVSMLACGEDDQVTVLEGDCAGDKQEERHVSAETKPKESEVEITENSDDQIETSTKVTKVEDEDTKYTDIEVPQSPENACLKQEESKELGDETSSTLPVVEILKELQNTLETERAINDSASLGENKIIEPTEKLQKTGDADAESSVNDLHSFKEEPETLEKNLVTDMSATVTNKKHDNKVAEESPASEIIEANMLQQDESGETEKIQEEDILAGKSLPVEELKLQEEHKEEKKVQDGISRAFEVIVEEKLNEETKEIAECKEETPADLVVPSEKQITEPPSEAEKESNEEHVESQAISDDTKSNNERDFPIEQTPKDQKEEVNADKSFTKEALDEQLQVPSSAERKPSELNQSHPSPNQVEETSFEVKKAQEDKNEETTDALITSETQVQDQSNDFEQEKKSSDLTYIQEDNGTNVKLEVRDDEIRCGGHDSVVSGKEATGLTEEKRETDYVSTEPEDAIKHGVSAEEKNNSYEKTDREATKDIYQEKSKLTDNVTAIKEEIREEEKETTQECFNGKKNTDDATEKTKPEIREIKNMSSVSDTQDKSSKSQENSYKQKNFISISAAKDEVPNQKKDDDVSKLENLKIAEKFQQKDGESELRVASPEATTVKRTGKEIAIGSHPKVKGTNKIEDKTTKPHIEEDPKTEEEDEDEDEHKDDKTSPDSIVMVEAKDTVSITKTHQKKSQGILSGVGSKVKHSISKVKKALTGKSSHTTKQSL